jgi:hypothetical protein
MKSGYILVPMGRKVSLKNKNLINEKRLFRAFLHTLSSVLLRVKTALVS